MALFVVVYVLVALPTPTQAAWTRFAGLWAQVTTSGTSSFSIFHGCRIIGRFRAWDPHGAMDGTRFVMSFWSFAVKEILISRSWCNVIQEYHYNGYVGVEVFGMRGDTEVIVPAFKVFRRHRRTPKNRKFKLVKRLGAFRILIIAFEKKTWSGCRTDQPWVATTFPTRANTIFL